MSEKDYEIVDIKKLSKSMQKEAIIGLYSIYSRNGYFTNSLEDPFTSFKEAVEKGKVFCLVRNNRLIAARSFGIAPGKQLIPYEIWAKPGQKEFVKKHGKTPGIILYNFVKRYATINGLKYSNPNIQGNSGKRFAERREGKIKPKRIFSHGRK